MMGGLSVVVTGMAVFFLAYIMRNYIKENLIIPYRTLQSYGFLVVFIGVAIYMLGAKALKVPIRNTTFYKLETIVKNEIFDPQRKDDYTKPIAARLSDLSDTWSMTTQVNVPGTANYLIPQVILGPGGAFTLWPVIEHPTRKNFKDPGLLFEKASKMLGDLLGVPVTPIMVFYTPKAMQVYKKKYEPVTRVQSLLNLGNFFEDRKKKLTDAQIADFETKVYAMIKGTRPGEKFLE